MDTKEAMEKIDEINTVIQSSNRAIFSGERMMVIGVVFVFSAIDQAQLIHPVVFLLLGILFILYGNFSIPAVTYIAWSYIVVGLAYALLTRYSFPNMWVYFTVYNGLSYVVMGHFLRQAREVA